MNLVRSRLVLLLTGASALGGFSNAFAEHATRAPVVIQRPLVNDGSNAARAPFPAQRPRDDVKPADGQAIDPDVPPNTPATDIPKPPPPTVAVAQRNRAPALTPTGPTTLAASVDAFRVTPGIRGMAIDSRETMLNELQNR